MLLLLLTLLMMLLAAVIDAAVDAVSDDAVNAIVDAVVGDVAVLTVIESCAVFVVDVFCDGSGAVDIDVCGGGRALPTEKTQVTRGLKAVINL